MNIINYLVVFIFCVLISTAFRINLKNEGEVKSPLYRALNRIRRSEDSNEVKNKDIFDDMEVENKFSPHGLHSVFPFPSPKHGHLPSEYPHFHPHFGQSHWQNGDEFEHGGYYGYHHHHHHNHRPGHRHGHRHGHGHGRRHGHGHGHGHRDVYRHEAEQAHVYDYGYEQDLNNEFYNHEQSQDDKSTPSNMELTTPSPSSVSVSYDIDVRLLP